jgi:subtilase family serine protease
MQKRVIVASVVALCAARMLSLSAQAGRHHDGIVYVPDSSREHDGERGERAHTNHVVHLRSAVPSGPAGETPASLLPYYLPAYTVNNNPNPGSGVIAIVDAYDYATALSDFNTFSRQFGLPAETSTNVTASSNQVFQVVYASGRRPSGNCGWNQEEALDIEWAHAVAPKAKIVLIEAASSSFSDLFKAIDAANALQVSGHVANMQVSMSWGGSEFSGETAYDSHFSNATIAYFAASGDTGGKTNYPSASPDVIAAGGTTLLFTSGAITGEGGWSGSGGGTSPYEPNVHQSAIASIVGTHRGTPDMAFDADPSTGVSVYDSTRCEGLSGWLVFGGTSVASPSLSGVINAITATYPALGPTVLPAIYNTYASGASYATDFHDVTTGTAGSFSAKTGWDFVTGLGSNKGVFGK